MRTKFLIKNRTDFKLDRFMGRVTHAGNTGFASGGLTWKLGVFVLLMNFSNELKLCAPKPAQTQSPKRLAAM